MRGPLPNKALQLTGYRVFQSTSGIFWHGTSGVPSHPVGGPAAERLVRWADHSATEYRMTINGAAWRMWGRKRAEELLSRAASWIAAEAREGRWHTTLAHHVGSLSVLGDLPTVRATAEGVLHSAPDSAFTAGVISNISDLSGLIRRAIRPAEQLESDYPSYSHTTVLATIDGYKEPHIRHVIDGKLGEAERCATTRLAMEEFASTCAVFGYLDIALSTIRAADYPNERKTGPLIVSCVESFRRGEYKAADQLIEELSSESSLDPWADTHVAAGLLNRIPWGGYPYPDY